METKTIISYIIYGMFTTIINILVYYILATCIDLPYLLSNAIAWFIAVIFAYVTNRLFVFSINMSDNVFWYKFSSFVGTRLISGVIDMSLMFLLVSFYSFNDRISKILVSFIVLIINYLISKFIIFV